MDDQRQIVCPHCQAINRLPFQRLDNRPKCGKCQQPLFQKRSITLTAANDQSFLSKTEIPVLVLFWADWCGYCQKIAPAFEQAAASLEPFVRLAKINTQTEPGVAAKYNISSLPTLIIFRCGSEIGRQAGALTVEQIVTWTRSKIVS